MAWLNYLPLISVVVLGAILVASMISQRLARLIEKIALATFGLYVDLHGPDQERARLLKSAYMATPYRSYAATSLLYSALAALAGSVVGVYLASGLLLAFPVVAAFMATAPIEPAIVDALQTVPALAPRQLFHLFLISSATVGVASWIVTYRLRWWLPRLRAHERRRAIDLTLPRTIAFMYALSRGGLEPPRILLFLRRHQSMYGAAAAEMTLAAKAIDVFGTDTVTAIREISRRTPSDQFRIFTENLASVLQSGRSVSEFLREQYEQAQEEATTHQEVFLAHLGAIAEGYVSVFVVGPLFLLTVLLIFGLISGGTTGVMAALIYGVMPAMNLGFIYYLARSTQRLGTSQVTAPAAVGMNRSLAPDQPQSKPAASSGAGRAPQGVAAGGSAARTAAEPEAHRAHLEQLAVYDQVQRIRRALVEPLATVRRRPVTLLYVTIPLALVWFFGSAMRLYGQGALSVTAIDDVFVQALCIIVIPFAVARRLYTARRRAIEQVVPDMFNRLASLNEAGIEIVDTFDQVRQGELGPLTPELERLWTDIQYGADVEAALYRLAERTRAPSITRAVTLITNGMQASGNIGPVLRIAADESRRHHKLKRDREQEMAMYLVIIYLSFLIFLTIVSVLIGTFIPAIPSQEALEGAGLSGAAAGITQEEAALFTTLLFHASLVQAVCSGLVAGQMSQGTIRDGAIHVAILMGLAYLLFSMLA